LCVSRLEIRVWVEPQAVEAKGTDTFPCLAFPVVNRLDFSHWLPLPVQGLYIPLKMSPGQHAQHKDVREPFVISAVSAKIKIRKWNL